MELYGVLWISTWRKGWDSNPRYPCRHAGFQDRCLKPLGHPSGTGFQSLIAADVPRQCEVAAIEPGPTSTVEEGREREARPIASAGPVRFISQQPPGSSGGANLIRSGRKPGGSSTAARCLPWLAPGTRRKLHLGCACYTCHSRCWSELIKDFGTGFLNAVACLQRVRPGNGSRQKRARGKCLR